MSKRFRKSSTIAPYRPPTKAKALRLEARKLHSQKVECACVYSAMFAFLGTAWIMAGLPSSFVLFGVNLALAFLYLYLSNRAKDDPKFCGRLAFGIAAGVWFYNVTSGGAGGVIPLILTSFAVRYEEPRQLKTPSQTPPQPPAKKRRKKI